MFYEIFFDGSEFVGRTAGFLTALLLVVSTVHFLGNCTKTKNCRPALFWLGFLLVFPPISCLVNIFTGSGSRAFRTMFAAFLLLPAATWLSYVYDFRLKKPSGFLKWTITILAFTIIFFNIRYINGAYTAQKILFDRTLYHIGRVIEDIQEQAQEDQKVICIGVFDFESTDAPALNRYKRIDGMDHATGVSYNDIINGTMKYLGYHINLETIPKGFNSFEEIREMPKYPEKGYIACIDGYMVVKLSE